MPADDATHTQIRCPAGTALQGGGPQWTSEIWYGKEDTTSGNIGDSSSGMGRIAWFDGKARKQVGDVTGFDTQIGRMQKDLLKCVNPIPLLCALLRWPDGAVIRFRNGRVATDDLARW